MNHECYMLALLHLFHSYCCHNKNLGKQRLGENFSI